MECWKSFSSVNPPYSGAPTTRFGCLNFKVRGGGLTPLPLQTSPTPSDTSSRGCWEIDGTKPSTILLKNSHLVGFFFWEILTQSVTPSISPRAGSSRHRCNRHLFDRCKWLPPPLVTVVTSLMLPYIVVLCYKKLKAVLSRRAPFTFPKPSFFLHLPSFLIIFGSF